MANTPEEIESLVQVELERIRISEMKEYALKHLITPRLHYRRWEYSREPVSYPCWLVADLKCKDVGIVYSEYGHGKHDPWGAVLLSVDRFFMDDRWFLTLEDAVINSGCWDGEFPEGYEIN